MAGELQIDEFLLKQAMTSKKKITRENAFSFAQTYTSHLYRFRFIRAYIKPEPNQISVYYSLKRFLSSSFIAIFAGTFELMTEVRILEIMKA